MPFALAKAFNPTYTPGKPEEDANVLRVRSLEWSARASVRIDNEVGKKFKVGFVQVLYESELVATYEQHTLKRVYSPLPVLDSDPGMFPWYDDGTVYSPEIDVTTPSVTVEATLYDRPQSGLAWYFDAPGTTDPLRSIYWRKKFKTWLVVRDITNLPATRTFAAVLAEFDTVLELDFNVFVAEALQPGKIKRCFLATGMNKKNKPELVSPPMQIHQSIWKDIVANSSYTEETSPRTVTKSSNAPVGPVQTSKSVSALTKQLKTQKGFPFKK
jgi:hypothetical protein